MSEGTADREDVPEDDYWVHARQPLQCLVFLLPLLIVYEVGVLKLIPTSGGEIRNGADFWLRELMSRAGLEEPWMLPAIVLGLLFLWQIAGRYAWRVSAGAMLGMLAESLLFGSCLIVLGQLQDLAFRVQIPQILSLPVELSDEAQWQRAVNYIGAGIYEEVLFRLLLLPAAYGLLRLLTVSRGPALLLAILSTSVVFAAAHYVGPAADAWSLYSFSFRALAGAFFGGLFVLRGFGITVGAHAAYDLLVGIALPALAMN
ncbi:MAG: CPBP family glutamic-type intramembrane protease [Planctomycetaceae bacterium]